MLALVPRHRSALRPGPAAPPAHSAAGHPAGTRACTHGEGELGGPPSPLMGPAGATSSMLLCICRKCGGVIHRGNPTPVSAGANGHQPRWPTSAHLQVTRTAIVQVIYNSGRCCLLKFVQANRSIEHDFQMHQSSHADSGYSRPGQTLTVLRVISLHSLRPNGASACWIFWRRLGLCLQSLSPLCDL